MGMVKGDPASLRTCASQVEQKIRELEELNKRLEQLLGRMGASWSGQSCDAYLTKMQERGQRNAQMVTVLESYRSYLAKVADRYEQIDKNGAARVRNS